MSKEVLLLHGPGYVDIDRPKTTWLSAALGDADPLGIRIIGTALRERGFNPILMKMGPGRIGGIERVMETVAAVFVSARWFDTDWTKEVISLANEQKVPVVSGGYGPSFNPGYEGATRVIGEAESLLPQIIDDLLSDSLLPEYNTMKMLPYDITHHYIRPDRTLPSVKSSMIAVTGHQMVTMEAMRGCFGDCSYCAVTILQKGGRKGGVRVRDIGDFISELDTMHLKPGDFVFLTDNNTALIPREWLLEFFREIKKRKLRVITEATIAPLLDDLYKYGEGESLLKAMSPKDGNGGCVSLAYGVDDAAREKVGGSFDKERSLVLKGAEIFRKFGIPLHFMHIVGLDNHTYPDIFFQVAKIAEEACVPVNFFFIATPYRPTPVGNTVINEGRIFEESSMRFNHHRVTFEPKHMTVNQLQQGYYWLQAKSSSPEMIARTAERNFNLDILGKDRFLAAYLSGLPWGLVRRLAFMELQARGLVDSQFQRELDHGYLEWRKKN